MFELRLEDEEFKDKSIRRGNSISLHKDRKEHVVFEELQEFVCGT